MNVLNTTDSSSIRPDGDGTIYPFWGRFKSRVALLVALAAGPPLLIVYLAALATLAIGLALAIVAIGPDFGNVWVVIALSLVAAVAEQGSIRLTSTIEESISLLPTVCAAVLFGPLASMTVSAASMIGDLRRREGVPMPIAKWAIYTSSRSITGGVTGLVAWLADSSTSSSVTAIAVATTAGTISAQSLDALFAGLTLKVRGSGEMKDVIKTVVPVAFLSVLLYAPLVAALTMAYRELSPWIIALFFVPALAAQRSFTLYQNERELAAGLTHANQLLESANLSFATALVATLDARDKYTAGHSTAVAIYAYDIAKRMGLNSEDQQLARLCGLVHDIGKIGLAAGLLEKPGPLTRSERLRMEEHPAIGERILRNVQTYSQIALIVRHHHERVDGNGYPDGLRGEMIPLLSRVIAVADAYNAMTSDRPYRAAMASSVARVRLAQSVGTQFDTTVVAAFEAVLTSSSEAYRTGHFGEHEKHHHKNHRMLAGAA